MRLKGRYPGFNLGAWDWVFHRLRPSAPINAIVYEIDGGEMGDVNTIIRAGVFEGDLEPTGRMLEGPFTVMVAKDYLRAMSMGMERLAYPEVKVE